MTGEGVLDLVALMDRLRSPGGCPWDAVQTHESLLQYLIEECYETVEAVELGDRAGLREELGDLLLQVVFHARVAAEDADDPFDIDDVAAGITTKLTRRHPHVFGDSGADIGAVGDSGADIGAVGNVIATDAADLEARWEVLKAAEKGRTSAMDGVPLAQPALALAAKVQSRARRAGVGPRVAPAQVPPEADLGDALFALVALAAERGEDPEAALRASARRFVAAVRAAELEAGS
ncbi:MAG TPA: MazG family protein [Sporichthyaceae bacterium]|jgi:XTP/dITP diphosphohydrolase|nr:MazG family protein [Sporichthyaceae bacterium]